MKRSALDSLPAARRKIVVALKISGELGAEQLAARVHTSAGAARQQLIAMRGEGYLSARAFRDGPGRPRLLYSLTDEGEALFPCSSNEQFTGVLEAARETDPPVLRQLLSAMTQRYADAIRPNFTGKPLEVQFEIGMDILRDQGYLPASRALPDGRWQLTLFHCPFADTARRVPEFCESELECFRALGCGGDVARVAHRIQGQATCTYLFWPAATAGN